MLPPEPEPLTSSSVPPLVAVIDSCVFPHTRWLDRIRDSAQAGDIVPVWSPLIVAEVTRLLTWQWLERNRGELTRASWARCSADAKRWFSLMSTVFRVAEDCPPREDAWDSPADEWDLPVWSAAKRCGAQFVVTVNLKDGPPEDDRGIRIFDGVIWCHPEQFLYFVEWRADAISTGEYPDGAEIDRVTPTSEQPPGVAPGSAEDTPKVFLDFLHESRAREQSRSTDPHQ
jgi:hypothetical protein